MRCPACLRARFCAGHDRRTQNRDRKGAASSTEYAGPHVATLWFQRRCVRRDGDHIVIGELGDGFLHERAPKTLAIAGLDVVELAHDIAGGSAGEKGHIAKPLQTLPVADRAADSFPSTALGDQILAFRLPTGT